MKKSFFAKLSLFIMHGICAFTLASCIITPSTSSTHDYLRYYLSDDGTYYCVGAPHNDSFEEYKIPATYNNLPVKEIDPDAFVDCANLTAFLVDESNPYFKAIDGNLYTKDGKTLVKYAPGKSDTAFTVPAGVEKIAAKAFYECERLTAITLPSSLLEIEEYAFSGCAVSSMTTPDSLKGVANHTFTDCVSLREIKLGNNIEAIGYSAFRGCKSLESVEIPASVKMIDAHAFAELESLKELVFSTGSTLEYINDFAFYKSGVTEVEIPDSVRYLGHEAFRECGNLTSVVVGSGLKEVGDYAFYNCNSLSEIKIRDGVKRIGGRMFSYAYGVERVVIPNSVESIGYEACTGCTALVEVVIGNGVEQIENEAFSYCIALENVVIGSGLKTVSYNSFEASEKIENIFYTGEAADWNSIEVVWYYGSFPITDHINAGDAKRLDEATRWYYSATAPVSDGRYWHFDSEKKVVVWD